MEPPKGEVTLLLQRLSAGDTSAEEALMQRVYAELHRLAIYRLKAERKGHTLQPTALVHEAYMRLCQADGIEWQDRKHFYFMATRIMRRILVDYARRRSVRPDGAPSIPAEDAILLSAQKSREAIEVNDLLDELAALSARQAKVVELRFFGGLAEKDIAEVLDVDTKTVQRDWAKAQAWLRGRMKRS